MHTHPPTASLNIVRSRVPGACGPLRVLESSFVVCVLCAVMERETQKESLDNIPVLAHSMARASVRGAFTRAFSTPIAFGPEARADRYDGAAVSAAGLRSV